MSSDLVAMRPQFKCRPDAQSRSATTATSNLEIVLLHVPRVVLLTKFLDHGSVRLHIAEFFSVTTNGGDGREGHRHRVPTPAALFGVNQHYWEFEIKIASLVDVPRATASWVPSGDQANEEMRSDWKFVSCFGGLPSRG